MWHIDSLQKASTPDKKNRVRSWRVAPWDDTLRPDKVEVEASTCRLPGCPGHSLHSSLITSDFGLPIIPNRIMVVLLMRVNLTTFENIWVIWIAPDLIKVRSFSVMRKMGAVSLFQWLFLMLLVLPTIGGTVNDLHAVLCSNSDCSEPLSMARYVTYSYIKLISVLI